jgi:P4 family phage/plasmid primase-like protien
MKRKKQSLVADPSEASLGNGEQLEETGEFRNDVDESDAEVVTGGGRGFSESQVADRLVRECGDDFRFLTDREIVFAFKNGLWLKDGSLQGHDTPHELFRCARRLCLRVYEEISAPASLKSPLRGAKFPDDVARIAAREIHHLAFNCFDQNPDLLGLPHGRVAELKTGVIRSATALDYVSKSTTVSPDPAQKPTRFLEFLSEISRHDHEWVEYILRCLGYFVTGHMTERYLGFWTGVTSNGKSILCDLLVSILGDYAATTSVKSLAAGSTENSEQEMRLFGRLCGARAVFASESSATLKIDIGLAKKLASKEKLTGRFLRENAFEFTPTFKTVISAQELMFEKVDAAIQARLQVCKFPQVFAQPKDMHRFSGALPADLKLDAKLERERAGILALILDYAHRWYADGGGLNAPGVIVKATDAYFADVDDFGSWLDTRCAREKDAFTLGNMLFADYTRTAGEMGIEPMKRDAFAKKIIASGFKADRRRLAGSPSVGGYVGLRLRERDEDGDNSDE